MTHGKTLEKNLKKYNSETYSKKKYFNKNLTKASLHACFVAFQTKTVGRFRRRGVELLDDPEVDFLLSVFPSLCLHLGVNGNIRLATS